ncbi:MAG: aspartate aminotransferase family protein [Ideonella sp.]|nr:aspartate aminotransferase family protein [Ideonella sp.]MCC7455551.1 aspartate aminotransferase family protein [Nitrospira sp.]
MDFPSISAAYAERVNAPYVAFLRRMEMLIDVVEAEGCVVRDRAGKAYIDCISGYGNCVLGHNPKPIVDAVVAEITSSRPFNLPFVHEVQARLAQRLAADSPGELECSFVVNSGSEAVETALKLARLATSRPGIISTTGSWHGFTFGCLGVSEPSMCRTFRPMLEGVKHVPYGDAAAVEAAIDERTGCVIVEPLQSESGAIVPPPGYLKALQELCARRKVVLIFDEAKTGIAKTGRLFCCEHDGAVPDILVCGKALGGGVMPVGAVIAKRSLWGRFGFSFPMSSSSGGGNAAACAAALATLELVQAQRLSARAGVLGNRLMHGLQALRGAHGEKVLGVSGIGLLTGVQMAHAKIAAEVVAQCAHRGVLVMTAFCDRSRLLVEPPICITEQQLDTVVHAIADAIDACSLA